MGPRPYRNTMLTGQAQSKKEPLLKLARRDEALPVERLLGLALLALLALGTFIILRPFISALLWAVIITYSPSGLNRRLQQWLNGRRSLAALFSTLLIGTLIVFPLVLVSATLAESAAGLVADAREALDRGIGAPPQWLSELPLLGPRLQAFWVAGVPGAFLLGFLCFFLTMVPLAPTFIWLPSSLYLFYNGSTGMAIALAIWSFLIFNPLENVLRPYLISRGSDLPILLILLGMLGGLAAFGLLGIFVGPTILAVGYGLLIDWIEPASQPPD